MFGVKKEIRQLQEALEKQTREAREWEQSEHDAVSAGLQRVNEEMAMVKEAVGKHDMTIEDMLDEWEEIRESRDQTEKSLQEQLIERQRSELEDLSGREKDMVEMTILAWDQIFTLRQAAEKAHDESWTRQLALAEKILREKALRLGLQQTGTVGEPFSYDVHEPVLRVDTDERERNMTIAAVYSSGYWYRGKAYRKAKVEVYRMKESEER